MSGARLLLRRLRDLHDRCWWGEATRLTDDNLRDHDPYFSPDGTALAWLTQVSTGGVVGAWDIRISGPDGSDPRRLVGDDEISSRPEWSRDSSTIFFHRLDPRAGPGFQIYAINPDGTGMREVTADQPGVNEYPST